MLRSPVIPGMNDDNEHHIRLKQFILTNGIDTIRKINLLPYHKTGSSKYKKFNIPYKMGGVKPPSLQEMQQIKDMLSETGVKIKIGG
jgi:pyruvate formate lyase activating enzyme